MNKENTPKSSNKQVELSNLKEEMKEKNTRHTAEKRISRDTERQ